DRVGEQVADLGHAHDLRGPGTHRPRRSGVTVPARVLRGEGRHHRAGAAVAPDGPAVGGVRGRPDHDARRVRAHHRARQRPRDAAAVQITGIPTYGLGVWRDVVAADDSIEIVSGSGALGFYPWIDRVHDTYGIVAVDDEGNGPEHAVPASQRVARMLWEAAA